MNLTDTTATSSPSGMTTSRRNLFRLGGLTLATGVLVAACGTDERAAHTGGSLPPELNPRDTTQDVATLVRTAQSIEHLLVATYATVSSEGWVSSSSMNAILDQAAANHEEHISALGDLAGEAGVSSYDEANLYLQVNVVDPVLDGMADIEADEDKETAATDLLYNLESMALQTYVRSIGMFPEASQRGTIATIAGASGRHIGAILAELGQPLPFNQIPVGSAAGDDALVHEDGPATVPPTTVAGEDDDEGSDGEGDEESS